MVVVVGLIPVAAGSLHVLPPCVRGFPLGILISSHGPKIAIRSASETVNYP